MVLRWGLCACGKISNDFANAMTACPDSVIVAVSTSGSVERAQTFAQQHPRPDGTFPTAFGTYDELIACDDVDIVYVGTVNTTHKEIAEKAMRRGKRVLCEKPLALSYKDVQSMVACSAASNRFLMEGMWTRFFPAMIKLRELIRSGAIGTVVDVTADFGFLAGGGAAFARYWEVALGGGALYDIGIYPLWFALDCFSGETPSEVVATGGLRNGVDEWMACVLKFADANGFRGRHATITTSLCAKTPEEWVVVGTQGRIKVHGAAHTPDALTVSTWNTDGAIEESVLQFPLPDNLNMKVPMNFTCSEGFAYEIRAVEQLLGDDAQAREHTLVAHSESLLAASLIEQARAQVGCTNISE